MYPLTIPCVTCHLVAVLEMTPHLFDGFGRVLLHFHTLLLFITVLVIITVNTKPWKSMLRLKNSLPIFKQCGQYRWDEEENPTRHHLPRCHHHRRQIPFSFFSGRQSGHLHRQHPSHTGPNPRFSLGGRTDCTV